MQSGRNICPIKPHLDILDSCYKGKDTNIDFHDNAFSGSPVDTCGQWRADMAEKRGTFQDFCEASNNV